MAPTLQSSIGQERPATTPIFILFWLSLIHLQRPNLLCTEAHQNWGQPRLLFSLLNTPDPLHQSIPPSPCPPILNSENSIIYIIHLIQLFLPYPLIPSMPWMILIGKWPCKKNMILLFQIRSGTWCPMPPMLILFHVCRFSCTKKKKNLIAHLKDIGLVLWEKVHDSKIIQIKVNLLVKWLK